MTRQGRNWVGILPTKRGEADTHSHDFPSPRRVQGGIPILHGCMVRPSDFLAREDRASENLFTGTGDHKRLSFIKGGEAWKLQLLYHFVCDACFCGIGGSASVTRIFPRVNGVGNGLWTDLSFAYTPAEVRNAHEMTLFRRVRWVSPSPTGRRSHAQKTHALRPEVPFRSLRRS